MKNFVAVRTKYYQSVSGKKVMAHGFRVGAHAKNENVTFPESSKYNILKEFCSFDEIEARHKETAGRKPAANRNAVFEHVLVFSADQFLNVKSTKKHAEAIEEYIKKINKEFGFEAMSYALHVDEGHPKNGNKRNFHAHIYFYNYDFKLKKAPLRELMIKGKNEKGQTNKKNPNFVKMQDLASDSFSALGYKRGISTDTKHLNKQEFIADKIEKKFKNLVKSVGKKVSGWLSKIENKTQSLEIKDDTEVEDFADDAAFSLDNLEDFEEKIKETKIVDVDLEISSEIENQIKKTENDLNLKKKEKITPKRKRRRRKSNDEN